MALKETNSTLYPKDRILSCPACGAIPAPGTTVYWSRESPHVCCQACLLEGAIYAAKLALKEKEEQEQQRNASQVKF